jgi:putative membrane protein
MSNERKEISPDSNKLALDRTVLANDRTYQSWIRTGLALFASGLGAAKFLKKEMPLWLLLVITSILLILSALAFLQAGWRYSHINIKFSSLDIKNRPTWQIWIVSILLASVSFAALVGILSAMYLID